MVWCKACEIELEADVDRCPKCLRKSTLSSAEDEAPIWIGPRAFVAVSAIALGVVVAWQAVAHERWLEAHHAWMASIVGSLGLVTMPLRVAFRMPSQARTTKEALGFYVLATLAVDGMMLVLAATVAVASLALDDSIAALAVGLFSFFMLLVAVPVAVVAVRRPHDLSATLNRAGKQALVLGGIAVLGTTLVLLRSADAPAQRTIVIPADPKALLDPMDLEHVALDRRTTHDTDGTTSRHLRADGGDIKRTLLKLDVAAISAVDDSKKDASASGLVTCWVPPRLRTPENEAELAKEQATMDATLAKVGAKTPSGRAVRVVFDFGDPPG